MTPKEKEFVAWYRVALKYDKALPCLKCSDKRIISCFHKNDKYCFKFKKYADPDYARKRNNLTK